MSSVTADYDKIYAGIRYFQDGREGIFVIDDSGYGNNTTRSVKFIQLGKTEPDQIMSDKRGLAFDLTFGF